jgi:predicted DNA-binding protein
MKEPEQNLDSEIHIRIPMSLNEKISAIALSYSVKKATLGRIILERHINDYVRSRIGIKS